MCYIDLEPCEVFNETVVKAARKEHVCSCCGGRIKLGEGYVKHFSIFDDDVTKEKSCLGCVATATEFQKVHGTRSNPSYMPDLLQQCIENEEDEGNTAMVEKWTTEIKAMKRRRELRKETP